MRRITAMGGMCFLAAIFILGEMTPAEAQCGDPCFADNDDILNGVQIVGPADDLVGLSISGGTTVPYQNGVWDTNGCDGSGCQVAPVVLTSVVSNDCGTSWLQSSDPGLDRYPIVFEAGRFFQLRNDLVVTIAPSPSATGNPCDGTDNLELSVRDPRDASHNSTQTFTAEARFLQLAKGDANRDGLDDLFFITDGGAWVLTAVYPSDPSQGFAFGPHLPNTVLSDFNVPVTPPSTGDLNADGLLDVAWVAARTGTGLPDQVFIGTICPGSVSNTVCDGSAPLEIVLNATPIVLQTSSWQNLNNTPIPFNTVVIGSFDPALAGDELAVLQQTTSTPKIELYTVLPGDASLLPRLANTISSLPYGGPDLPVFSFHASAAPLLFDTTPVDHLIYSLSWVDTTGGGGTPIEPVTKFGLVVMDFSSGIVNPPLVTDIAPVVISGGFFTPGTWLGGHAAGRFAGIDSQTTSFDLQIALLTGNFLRLWRLDVSSSGRSLEQTFNMSSPGVHYQQTFGENIQGAPLIRAADMQGRSLRLGAPEIVRITSHSQPSVIVGAPPTHIDHITPSGASAPTDLNVSAVSTYSSSFSIQGSAEESGSQQSTTSYTYAHKDTDQQSAKVSFPSQALNSSFGFSVGQQSAVTKTYTNTQSSNNSQYERASMDVSTKTFFDDLLWYESSAVNIYHYPVIGVLGCPDGASCAADEEVPLYVNISGPDTTHLNAGIPGAAIEWYQPVHEIGNVLSYASTTPLVQSRLGGATVKALSEVPTLVIAAGVVSTESVGWGAGGSSSQTSGTTNTFAQNKSMSYSQNASLATFASGKASESVDENKSTSWSTLNISTTKLAASTGVSTALPGTSLSPADTYEYAISPAIYGYDVSEDTAQVIDLDVDIPAVGPLTVAYAVDIASEAAGAWWTGTNDYQLNLDVSLNHPARWSLSVASNTGDNCRSQGGGSGAFSCAFFNQRDTNAADPWQSSFLHMKGFFITSEASQGEGPLISTVTEGDGAFLEARVYNYSLTPVPTGSQVHVRFYAQEWCTDTSTCGGVNIAVPGVPSELINDVIVSQNPLAFDPTGTNDNFVTASTVFDTTGRAGKIYVFWVVVYIEDASGKLVSEIPLHGIDAVPGASIGIDAPNWLEFAEAYSNNVGLFRWPLAVESAETSAIEEAPAISIDALGVAPLDATIHEVTTLLAAERGVHRGGVAALAARGPAGGNQVFDLERTPYFEAVRRGGVRTKFQAQTCGSYVISLAIDGTALRSSESLEVPCDVGVGVQLLPPRPPRGDVGAPWRLALLGSSGLEAEDIAVETIQAGPGRASPVVAARLTDVNRDGRLDLVMIFGAKEVALEPGASELCITGMANDGRRFATCVNL